MAKLTSFSLLLKQILHLQESTHRTALAFAVGVLIAFSPTYGLHTVLVLFCTWKLNLNFPALMAGALINNPWTLIPILGATYWIGALLLGRSNTSSFDWPNMSLEEFYSQAVPYTAPLLLGGLVLSLLGAVFAYPFAYYFLKKYRGRHSSNQPEPLPASQDLR